MRLTLLCLLVLLCGWPAIAWSQRSDTVANQYKAAFRFNFTGLLDPIDNNISVGGEYCFNPHVSATLDVAFIEVSSYFNDLTRTSGYILRPSFRYYPGLRHKAFIEGVLFYKHVNYHISDWLGRACVNGVPVYEENTSFVYGKRVSGINFQAGIQESLSRNKRLRMEAYLGVGVRQRKQDVIREENSCYNQQLGIIDINGISGSAVLSSLPWGLRLIYCFE